MRRRVILLISAVVIAQAVGLLGLAPAHAVNPTTYRVSKSDTSTTQYIAKPYPANPDGPSFGPGTLKSVVESAVGYLEQTATSTRKGTVQFCGSQTVPECTAGDFNLGSAFFKFDNIHDLVFEGAGTGSRHRAVQRHRS